MAQGTETTEAEKDFASLRPVLEGLETIFEGVILFNDDFRILALNASALSVLGLDGPDAAMGRPLEDLARAAGFAPLTPSIIEHGSLDEELSIESPEGVRFFEIRARRVAGQRMHWMALRETTAERRRRWGDATYAAVTKVLVETTSLAEALPKLLDALASALEWSVAELFRVDREAGILRWEAGWREGRKGGGQLRSCRNCSFALGEGTLGAAWASATPVWIEELRSDPSLICRASAQGSGLKSALAFPIRVGGEVVGVLVFFSEERRGCEDGIVRLLRALDPLIGQFLERVRLLEAEQEQRREGERIADRLRALQRVTTSLASSTTPGEVGRILLAASTRTFRADSAVLYLLDPAGTHFELREWLNFPFQSKSHLRRFGFDAPGPIPEAIRDGRAIYITTADELMASYPRLAAEVDARFETWVVLPLIAHGRPLGVIGLSFIQPTEFSREDRAMLDNFAWQGALALDRVRLFEAERIAKERAQTERARFRSILMSAPIPVVVYRGPKHVIELANPAWLDILVKAGGTDDVIGKELRDAPEPLLEAAEQIATELDSIHRTGEARAFAEYPLSLPRPDGTREMRYYAASATPIRDDAGDVESVVQLTLDITDQVLARQRDEAARAHAEAATRAKDEFLAILSHELRTPLQSMLGWTHLLLSRPFDPELTRRGIQTLERNTKQQAKLIEELLDISRIVTGKILLDRHPLDVGALIETAVESLRTQAAEKKVELSFEQAPNIQVFGDGDRLRQVAMNLLSNAVKFTPEGGRVMVKLDREGSLARLTVTDTGKGISPAMLETVFDPFRQADISSRKVHGGLGLGLAIVKHLVKQHGGHVWAESEGEGHGATFTVTLPLLLHREGIVGKAEDEAPSISLAGIRALIVDDDPDASEVVAMTLRERGVEVTVAYSVSEAIESFWEARHDVLVSDVALKDDDGYELLRQVREIDEALGRHTAAMALTAYASASDREEALRAGFEGYLAKPVSPADLVREVAEIVERG